MNKISIITVSYNSETTIADTIESVLSQDYADIEYIVVDGLSLDNTVNIIKSFGSKINVFLSEKDNGLYDAMNKGIEIATGNIIGILNSDDVYAHHGVISKINSELYYFKTGFPNQPIRFYRGGVFSLNRVSYGLVPPHPTFFIKKKIYNKYGKFNLQFTLSADFDLILRFLGVHKVLFSYIPEILVKMRTGGKSTSSLKRTFIMNSEDLKSCRNHGVRTNLFKFYLKYFIKVFHIFK
jgi:glycosyltransferase involved in cell wall biosynthesis